MLDRLEDMREDLNHNDFADDVNTAKKAIDLHNEAKRKILKVPVENIDNVGQRLLQRWFKFQNYITNFRIFSLYRIFAGKRGKIFVFIYFFGGCKLIIACFPLFIAFSPRTWKG